MTTYEKNWKYMVNFSRCYWGISEYVKKNEAEFLPFTVCVIGLMSQVSLCLYFCATNGKVWLTQLF